MALLAATDVINRFRSDVDDPLRGPASAPDDDCLWSINDVAGYLADAVERVAVDTLTQFTTFNLAVVPGQPFVTLPSAYTVQDIELVFLTVAKHYLEPRNVDGGFVRRGDYESPWLLFTTKWEDQVGTPKWYIRNMVPGKLRLVPIPSVADSLEVSASVIPTYTAGAPLPFNTLRDQYLVLLWMKKLAYSKHDADTYDPQRASQCMAEYEALALERKYEAQRVRRAAQPVRFSW